MYVVIAGNIGVGKSSLTEVLAARCSLQPMFESVDEHPYLEDFYHDMSRYAYHSQMYFLTQRFEQHLHHIQDNHNIVQDRSLYEDAEIFARHLHNEGIMSRRDFSSYWRMYDAIRSTLRPPDLLIYLRASLPTLRQRIHQRGRDFEASIHNDYLLKLNALYERWITNYDLSKVLIINADKLDFVNDCVDLNAVLHQLEHHGLSSPILRVPPSPVRSKQAMIPTAEHVTDITLPPAITELIANSELTDNTETSPSSNPEPTTCQPSIWYSYRDEDWLKRQQRGGDDPR
jgi:deoxyadenosine/deoxycytidine kinase